MNSWPSYGSSCSRLVSNDEEKISWSTGWHGAGRNGRLHDQGAARPEGTPGEGEADKKITDLDPSTDKDADYIRQKLYMDVASFLQIKATVEAGLRALTDRALGLGHVQLLRETEFVNS